jgi:hypothetical protein
MPVWEYIEFHLDLSFSSDLIMFNLFTELYLIYMYTVLISFWHIYRAYCNQKLKVSKNRVTKKDDSLKLKHWYGDIDNYIHEYGGWFGTLRVALSITTTQPISVSPFRLVASDNTTKRQTASCRAVVLRLAKHAKRRVCRAARFRPVAWFISQSSDLNRVTMWHRENTLHDNASFGVYG